MKNIGDRMIKQLQCIELGHRTLYNNQINAHALIGQSAMVYCASKPIQKSRVYWILYNNQVNAHALIGQSAMVYCAGKFMEKSRVFWIII